MTNEEEQPIEAVEPGAADAAESAHVEFSVDVKPGMRVYVTIVSENALDGAGGASARITAQPLPAAEERRPPPPVRTRLHLRSVLERVRGGLQKQVGTVLMGSTLALFAVGMLVYLIVQFTGLGSYPAHFSCDEAVSMVKASMLVSNGMRGEHGELLPTFMKNDGQYSLSTTVYLAILPYLLFGKSVLAARAVTAVIALLGALCLALFLRDYLRLREWWLGPLLLASTPAWFFLARTGMETAQMAAFYIGFWYFYAGYRYKDPRLLFPALILGGLTFYTYTPGQVIIVATGLILLVADWRYHWEQRSTAWKGLLVLAVLAIPLVRFMILEPDVYVNRLGMYNSYLVWQELNPLQKAGRYLGQYLGGLSPVFWFSPHTQDENIRYTLGSHPPLALAYAPFLLAGLYAGVRKWRTLPGVRMVFYALLAAPSGAALVLGATLPRLLAVVIPLVLLTALGVSTVLKWLEERWPRLQMWPRFALLVFLAAAGVLMMTDANKNGARWLTDYGLGGLQWGAPQVYRAALDYAGQHPDETVLVSPNWTFQGETLRNFFTNEHPSIYVRGVADFFDAYHTDIGTNIFVLTPDDARMVEESGKFKPPQVAQTIQYPDGNDGFYWVHLEYVDDIDRILEAERAERRKLVTDTVMLDGEKVIVHHSSLDMGELSSLFDGNKDTLARSAFSNPLVVGIDFKSPRPIQNVTVLAGAEPVTLTVEVTDSEGAAHTFETEAGLASGFKDVSIDFGSVLEVKSLKVLLYDVNVPEPTNVHLWEIQLK